jgi:succinyl-CoA synthetase beta subunit
MYILFSRPDEAKQVASKMLGHRLYTKQTGREGKPVNKLILCEKLFTRREYYFACSYFFCFFLLKSLLILFL